MSNYKTPIRIHLNSTRKINEKITKYRLPFKKDEPSSNREYQMTFPENSNCVIESRVKDKNDNSVVEERQKGKESNGKEERKGEEVKKEKREKGSENQEKGKQTLGGQQYTEGPKKMEESTSVQNVEESPKEGSVPSKNNLKIISAIKPRIFQEDSEPKKDRYLNVVNQYQEQINYADRSLQSDADISYGPQKRYESSVSKEEKKEREGNLPQLRSRCFHSSLHKRKEQKKGWGILSQEIEECKDQVLAKEPKKRRKRSSQFKINKLNFSSYEEDNQCLNIQNELKKLNRDHPEMELVSKQDFYVDLPPIPEDADQSRQKKRQNTFIEKLKQAIQFQQQNKKTKKTKFPLQYYVEHYYKIREINPFFRKLNELGGCIMLSIGKLKVYESGHQIYQEGQPITYIYVNIVGKIFLSNTYKSFKKFALTGQTLGEESLFQEGKPYGVRLAKGSRPMFHRQQARSMSKVCLLRIKLQKYFKMSNQLCSIGYRNMFNLIDNLFRINYFKKQSLHHSYSKQRIQTESLVKKRSKVSSQFFY